MTYVIFKARTDALESASVRIDLHSMSIWFPEETQNW